MHVTNNFRPNGNTSIIYDRHVFRAGDSVASEALSEGDYVGGPGVGGAFSYVLIQVFVLAPVHVSNPKMTERI